ncbi:hypothetical protein NKH18_48450 [Streptomyces sp. M10(2022)]
MTRALPDSLLHERRAIRTLTLPGLIRLITEIDDNGPISYRRGSLQGALGDLTPGQLRHAIDTARALNLVHSDETTPDRYRLTESGEALAEVYDTAARWARARQLPPPRSTSSPGSSTPSSCTAATRTRAGRRRSHRHLGTP